LEEESAYKRKDGLKPKSITETGGFDFENTLLMGCVSLMN